MTCASAEFPIGKISSVWSNLCESIKGQRETDLLAYWPNGHLLFIEKLERFCSYY